MCKVRFHTCCTSLTPVQKRDVGSQKWVILWDECLLTSYELHISRGFLQSDSHLDLLTGKPGKTPSSERPVFFFNFHHNRQHLSLSVCLFPSDLPPFRAWHRVKQLTLVDWMVVVNEKPGILHLEMNIKQNLPSLVRTKKHVI